MLGSVPIAPVTAHLIHALQEAWIMAELFWLSDEEWAAIEPLLPRLGGKPRQDDRRVISGILHKFREGLRWRALPAEYGPRTTLFNRFNRWSKRGIWQNLLSALAAREQPPETAIADSSSVRAHRSAASAKGGSEARPSGARAVAARPKSTPSAMAKAASMP
jgi:transposase